LLIFYLSIEYATNNKGVTSGKSMAIKKEFISALFLTVTALYITGCSTSTNKAEPAPSAPNTVSISTTDLQALKKTADEWKSAESKVNHLLQLENQLAQLKSRLKTLNEGTKQAKAESILKSDQAFFAIQVAAFKNKSKLQTTLAKLKLKAPEFFDATLIVNIEPKVINNSTIYRLKLGAYKNKAEAENHCYTLKKQQINCFISYYTEQQP
jgi:cell division septation protein DedD